MQKKLRPTDQSYNTELQDQEGMAVILQMKGCTTMMEEGEVTEEAIISIVNNNPTTKVGDVMTAMTDHILIAAMTAGKAGDRTATMTTDTEMTRG